MKSSLELVLAPEQAADEQGWRAQAAEQMGLPVEAITAVQVRKRSVDARRAPVRVRLQVEVYVDEPAAATELPKAHYPAVSGERRVIVVGAGPAGLFAALRLIELGVKPVVVERGKDVQARRRDLAAIHKQGLVDPDSNYCFGEGGAGTYSDGKLYTRSTKRGDVAGVLRTLVAHGAPADILIDAHPHIGSNRLPRVVVALRESICRAGGEVLFGKRIIDILLNSSGRSCGVITASGEELTAAATVLATGHSARDVFRILQRRQLRIEAKPFAVGVRIEHPQPLIDRLQYHTESRHAQLPAASYRLSTTVGERGVFSFCMCPGGFIVPAATEADEVVVNGMSLSRRDSAFANSGMVMAVELEDLGTYRGHGPLAGMQYQSDLESTAARAGGGLQRAPAQRLTDFLSGRESTGLPRCSYRPGLTEAPLHELLPAPLVERLQVAMAQFGRRMRGYVTEEAVLVGVETRTSSPVRIPRHPHSLQHPDVPGLYPCGEGAGYAGGIVSAALDGIRIADAVAS